MIEAAVNWTDKERYVGAATSRHSLVMDTAAEKTASSPMELVLIALCGCTASDVVGVLRKKREPFTGLEVRAKAERAGVADLRSIWRWCHSLAAKTWSFVVFAWSSPPQSPWHSYGGPVRPV